jgi:four helix bundle protein
MPQVITQELGYRKLIVWQKADALAYQVCIATRYFPKEELYGMTSQLRRAALSIPTNIVEGYARVGVREKLQFCNIAYGSAAEVEYLLDFSQRLEYLAGEEYNSLVSIRDETARVLNGYMKSLKQ